MESTVAKFMQLRPLRVPRSEQIVELIESPFVSQEVKRLFAAGVERDVKTWAKAYMASEDVIETAGALPAAYQNAVRTFRQRIARGKLDSDIWQTVPSRAEFKGVLERAAHSLLALHVHRKHTDLELEQHFLLLGLSLEPASYEGPYLLRYPSEFGAAPPKPRPVERPEAEEPDRESRLKALRAAAAEVEAALSRRRNHALAEQRRAADVLAKPAAAGRRRDSRNQPADNQDAGADAAASDVADLARRMKEANEIVRKASEWRVSQAELPDSTKKILKVLKIDDEAELTNVKVMLNRAVRVEAQTLAKTLPNFGGGPSFPTSPAGGFRIDSEVKELGIADLRIIKETILRYEAREISHITNVLAGEHKEREHERSTLSESFVDELIETQERSQHELETTERHELQTETSLQIQAQFNNETWASGGGSYGPVANFEAGTALAIGATTNFATSSTQNFSREVVTKAVEEITKKTSKRITTSLRREFRERNTHGFDNAGTDAKNIAGIYLYVQKVLNVQEYNYGSRYLLSVTIPRPSENLIDYAANDYQRRLNELDAPPEFDIDPGGINENNYEMLTARYRASGVEPPPLEFQNISHTVSLNDSNVLAENLFSGNLDQKFIDWLYTIYARGARWSVSGALEVPEGYEALRADYVILHPRHINDNTNGIVKYYEAASLVQLNVGETSVSRSYNLAGDTSSRDTGTITIEPDVTNAISFGVAAWALTMGTSITIDLKCQRTDHALDQWRMDTYEKLYAGYISLKSLHEEKLAVLDLQGKNAASTNPALNRLEERKEIKALVTRAILDQAGVTVTQANYTVLQKFFELAVEWNNISYKLITERKGAQDVAMAKLHLHADNDYQRNEFLRAQGAIVLVPVRTDYAVSMRLLAFHGMVEGNFVNMEDPAFLLEVLNDQYGDDEETPEGEPFEVSLPTSLVYLQEDGKLPDYSDQT